MTKPLRMIDLFAGCGGLTEGFVQTGAFEPVAAVESAPHAAATYAQNFGDHVFVGDIAEWVGGSMPQADVVVGGPPCQGFSALGKQDNLDPRNQLWRHYVAALERIRPAFFVMENVPQLLKSDEWKLLSNETRAGGSLEIYDLESFVLNAADYGVPQARKRAIVIGRRKGMRPVGAPVPTSRQALRDAFPAWLQEDVSKVELPETSIDFRGIKVPGAFKVADLHVTRKPDALSQARYRAIPPGGSRHDLPYDLQTRSWRIHKSGAGDVMGRLRWDRPSVTIRTEFFKPEKGRYLHPSQHRPISHAEAALIQGFPEDFVWCGTKASIARQIGNAVPPPLAKSVATHLLLRIAR